MPNHPWRARPALLVVLLLATPLGLLLDPSRAVAAWCGLAVLVVVARDPLVRPRVRWITTGGLLLAALLFGGGWLIAERAIPDNELWLEELGSRYADLWAELDDLATRAAATVATPPVTATDRLEVFARLDAVLDTDDTQTGSSLLLYDMDGQVAAWAGAGLLHEPQGYQLRDARWWQSSITAVTLLAVAPIGDDERPWRLAAGRSLATTEMPFARRPWSPELVGLRWSVGDGAGAGPVAAVEPVVAVLREDLPTIYLTPPRFVASSSWISACRRAAAIVLALMLALVTLDVQRGGRRDTSRRRVAMVAVLAAAAAGCASGGAGIDPALAAMLAFAVVIAVWGLLARRRRRPVWRVALTGGGAMAGLVGFAWCLHALEPTVQVNGFFGGADAIVTRAITGLLAFGLLSSVAAGRRRLGEAGGWLTLGIVVVASASHETPWLAVPLIVLAGMVAALTLGGRRAAGRPLPFAALMLVSTLLGASAWETVDRGLLHRHVERDLLPAVAVPTAAEINTLAIELEDFFRDFDVSGLLPPGPSELDPQDLAYAVWRASPLAERDGLSAVVIDPINGEVSRFAFDLVVDENFDLRLEPEAGRLPASVGWRQLSVDTVTVNLAGAPWAELHYAFVPRPGFRLAVSEVEELEESLLRGRLHREPLEGLPEGVYYALYDASGRAGRRCCGSVHSIETLR
ncbi:MAG: hypothetical protein AAGD38_19300 [Acidobacteriota bacterium]